MSKRVSRVSQLEAIITTVWCIFAHDYGADYCAACYGARECDLDSRSTSRFLESVGVPAQEAIKLSLGSSPALAAT